VRARAKVVELREAVAGLVSDGNSVALEGFTHLIPTAGAHEIIRQRRRNLTLIRMTPDLIYDQMIGMGCADKLVFQSLSSRTGPTLPTQTATTTATTPSTGPGILLAATAIASGSGWRSMFWA
jgi:acyl CoA:acetate/3-ketoacid CoA transferase alpha subunit